MQGWISVHRELLEHWLWDDKPFARGQAWVDILMKANHQPKEVYFDGTIHELEKGQFITSIKKLCMCWGWSNTKVNKFLDVLRKENMIEIKKHTKNTVIKVLNYAKFQDITETKNIDKTYQKHIKNETEAYQEHTNNTQTIMKTMSNNDNNVNNDKQNIYSLVVAYLNEKTDSNYRANSSKTRSLIDARCNEGFVLKDFQKVIDNKVSEWKGTDYEKYLRPETLFSNKFESYLNQKQKKRRVRY